MYYDKQIRYIDYLENGEKQSNCGYVKITVMDNRLLLEMQIKGLYETDDVVSEVALEGAGTERRIGTVLVQQGSGSFRWEIKDSAHTGEALIIGEGLCYGQLERVRVQLSPRRSLRCVWREGVPKPQAVLRQSEPRTVGQGMPEDNYADSAQTGSEYLQNNVRKLEEPVPETPDRARDTQIYNPGAYVLEAAAEEGRDQAERASERITTSRITEEKASERTAKGGDGAEKPSGSTTMGRTEAEKHSERTATSRVSEERGSERNAMDGAKAETASERTATGRAVEETASERTATGRAVEEKASERIGTGRTEAERDGIGRMTARTVAESAASDGSEAGRTEMGRSVRMEADQRGDETENPAGEKIPGEATGKAGATGKAAAPGKAEAGYKAGGKPETVTKEAELHQADASGRSGENEITPENRQASQPPRMAAMSEDKWQQLWKIYPHIRPFQDEREYLSLRPEDFVILHSSAYRLAQNSFLLHGYFNYEHLMLTQVTHRNGNQYYIGVPGNFYEKEKQVAIMYGFGSFECRREPAQEGDFGYYMIKVEL